MDKSLYLSEEHMLRKSDAETGSYKGGAYQVRIQTGIEKDGSPQYRYFTTAEYEDYLANQKEGGKGSSDKKPASKKPGMHARDTEMEEKLDKENKESRKYARGGGKTGKLSKQHSQNRSLYAGSTASVKKYSVKKSIDLYLSGDK